MESSSLGFDPAHIHLLSLSLPPRLLFPLLSFFFSPSILAPLCNHPAAMGFGSAALKLGSTALYAIEFACAAIVLGIYSYFLSVQADRDEPIATSHKAVTGLSGAVVLYTIFAVLLTCFLGGKAIFALLGMLFNILCCGAMVAIAVLTRDGAHSCSGYVNTPLGDGASGAKEGFDSNGQGRQITYAVSLGTACRLNTACFAVSIIGA